MTSLDDSVSPELIQVAEQAWLSATDDPIGDGLAAAVAAVEPLIRVAERARHHRMEIQGGWVRTCCPHCKSHVQPHLRCILRDNYTGPLPEGHRWDDDARVPGL